MSPFNVLLFAKFPAGGSAQLNIIWPGFLIPCSGLAQFETRVRFRVLRRGEDAMGAIMIRCPKTDELIPVGIDTDRDTFAVLPDVVAKPVRCPARGGQHAWSKKDAVLETTMRIRSK